MCATFYKNIFLFNLHNGSIISILSIKNAHIEELTYCIYFFTESFEMSTRVFL